MYMRLSLITVIREEGMGTSGMRSARPAARLDASFCCCCERALALSELRLFPNLTCTPNETKVNLWQT